MLLRPDALLEGVSPKLPRPLDGRDALLMPAAVGTPSMGELTKELGKATGRGSRRIHGVTLQICFCTSWRVDSNRRSQIRC